MTLAFGYNIMKSMYTVANVNILIDSHVALSEHGFSSLFAADADAVPDFVFTIFSCRSLPYADFPDDSIPNQSALSVTEQYRIDRCGDFVCTTFFSPKSGEKYMQLISTPGSPNFEVYLADSELSWAADMYYLWPVLNLQSLLLKKNMLLVHAAYIEYQNTAMIFTAPSRAGKTTQAKLWRDNLGARIINGDRAVLSVSEKSCVAHSVPISGTSRDCVNASFPVRAIAVVSKSGENKLKRLNAAEAFRGLIENSAFNKRSSDEAYAAFDIVSQIADSVPVFSLECLPERSAAELLLGSL